jgi:UDPglucose 6-dehydrogenase
MNVLVVGSGFVGTTHAAVLASHGHVVLSFDVDKKKVDALSSNDPFQIDNCVYEPGLSHLIVSHKSNLSFSSSFDDVKKVADTMDVVFLCLPSPSYELELPIEERFTFKAAKQLSEVFSNRNKGAQSKYVLFVNKSTVPIGTVSLLKNKFEVWGVKNFGVASNPEFLVEGKAVIGSQNPDRVVIGVSSPSDDALLRSLYLNISSGKIKTVTPSDAEAIKLLANFELFSTIVRTFQVVGRLCEVVPGLTYENVIAGITSDSRIPKWGHYTSLYSGGSCFEKDALNLLKTLSGSPDINLSANFVKMIIDGNTQQLHRFYNRAKIEAKFSFENKTIALLGVAFKQDTNDVRMSPALRIAEWLNQDGVKLINVYDPQASNNFVREITPECAKKVKIQSFAKDALSSADVVIIATDWPEFKFLSKDIIDSRPKLLMDGRRSLSAKYSDIVEAGVSIVAVGSAFLSKK